MADEIEYQRLVVKVVADTSEVTTNLKKFNSSLLKLESVAKNLDFDKIKEVQKLLQGIANIDFSNVAKGLQDVVSAFKAFNNKKFMTATNGGVELEGMYPKGSDDIFTQMNAINNIDFTKPQADFEDLINQFKEANQIVIDFDRAIENIGKETTFEDKLQEIGLNAKQITAVFAELEKDFSSDVFSGEQLEAVRQLLKEVGIEGDRLANIMGDLKTENPFSAMGFNGKQVAEIMKAINYETGKFTADDIKKLEQGLKDLGYSEEDVKRITSQLAKDVNKLDKNAQKASTNGLKKLLTQFVRIARYRVIRKIIQEVYKALQEGIKNVIEFDEATSKTVDELSAKFEYLKNSLGAMFAPLIQIVAPILNMLMQVVGDLGNTFAEFFAGANGQTTFSKAKDDLEAFNKEAKKTTTLGIDELNIISDTSNDFFTTEQVNLGEEENALANQLGETFAKFKEVVERIIEAFRDLMEKILPAIARLFDPIVRIIDVILGLVDTLVNETFEGVNNSLVSFTDMLGAILDCVASILEALSPALEDVVKVVAHVINIINSSLGMSFKMIGDIFKGIQPIVSVLAKGVAPIVEGIAWVLEKICGFIDWINNNIVSKAWEEIKSWFTIGIDDRTTARANTRSFATGGFPEDGFFFANHNELIGQFSNGQTAVANNQQITQGIYEAVLQAMREGGGNQDIIINLDGNELARVVTKRQNNFGADVVLGGNINWGK